MAKVSGLINLANVRSFGRIVNLKKSFSVQLLCTNLSANTTCTLQLSNDNINWCNAQENGTDVTFTLVDDTVMFKSFEADSEVFWRILFGGVTTGTVNYIIN